MLRKTGADVFIDAGARRLTTAAGGLADLNRVVGWFDESGIAVDDLGLARPSLDDVFLSLTGHRAEDETTRDGDANTGVRRAAMQEEAARSAATTKSGAQGRTPRDGGAGANTEETNR